MVVPSKRVSGRSAVSLVYVSTSVRPSPVADVLPVVSFGVQDPQEASSMANMTHNEILCFTRVSPFWHSRLR